MNDLRQQVSRACRVLARSGHEHFCYGHVSVRDGDLVLMKAAGVSLLRTTEAHVATVGMDGANHTPDLRIHDEVHIHLGIYRARADVGAVVHTHSVVAQAATALGVPEDVFSQDGVPFADSLARYPSAALVSSPAAGDSLAACLGGARAALLENHGIVVTGADVREATVLALLLDRALRVWLQAASAGHPRPIAAADLAELRSRFDAAHDSRVRDIWDDAVADLPSP